MRLLSLALGLILSWNLFAAIDTYRFNSVEQEQQYRELTEQLRCPKCQNNSIADSNATIAADMRAKVYELMQQGNSKQQIIEYMVDRYGNFVTYQPPLTAATLILWVGPVMFILIGAAIVILRARRGVAAETPLSPQESQRLQQHLLTDIPSPLANDINPINRWALLPGVVISVLVAVGLYLKTGSWDQVTQWRQIEAQMPELRARVANKNAEPLTIEEIARLGLGLRTSLQRDAGNINDWMMLGRVGIALNNATTATQAFAKAYQRAPDDNDVKLGYAEVLTRSSDPQDNQLATQILRTLIGQDSANLRALSLLAFNAFEQEDFKQAIGAWEVMLTLLPADDSRIEVIKRSIQQATSLAGQETATLEIEAPVR